MNGRVVLWGLGSLVMFGGLMHLVHELQVDRNAKALRQRAAQLSAEGERQSAIDRFQQYVLLRPDDIEAWRELGELLDKSVDPEHPTAGAGRRLLRAYLANEKVLSADPARNGVRRRNAEIAMMLGDYSGAQDHWRVLLKASPGDGELEYQHGLSQERLNQPGAAAAAFERAIDKGHHPPELFLRTATLYQRQLKQPARAGAIIEQMMVLHGDSAEALRARAGYDRMFGTTTDALRYAREAAKRNPDDLESQLMLAELSLQANDIPADELEALRQSLESQLKGSSPEAGVYDVLARIYVRQQNTQRAIELLREGRDRHPQVPQLAWRLADLLIAGGEIEEARQELVRLRKIKAAETPTLYLEGRVLMADGKFAEAARRLETVEARADKESPLYRFAALYRGVCFGRMGRAVEQFRACRRVLAVDRNSLEARLGLAAALESLGKSDEAADIYRSYQNIPGVPLRLARLLYRQQQQLPAGRRDWEPVEEAIANAEAAERDSVPLALLRAEFVRASGGDAGKSRAMIEALHDGKPENVRSWTAAIAVAMRGDDWREKAGEILRNAEQTVGDLVELRLAQAVYWSRVGGARAERRLPALEADIEKFPADDRIRLLEGLALIRFFQGDSEAAIRLWTEVSSRRPDHVPAQFRLFRLAVGMNDGAAADLRMSELKRIEGKAGPHVLVGEAIRLIARARRGEPVSVAQPRALLNRAAKSRPEWAIIPLAQAEIEELEGNYEAALKQYRRAIELENRDPGVLRRTVELLLSRGRSQQARALIEELTETSPISVQSVLRQLQAEIALVEGKLERAKESLAAAVSGDSRSFHDRLWLGRMLVLTGQGKEAERHFEKAVELAPSEPEAWIKLVAYLVQSGRRADAEAAVTRAEKSLNGAAAFTGLARCYEMIGKLDLAQENYRRAASGRENSISAIREQVGFLLRNDGAAQAEKLLAPLLDRQKLRQPVDVQWARRTLAQIRARRDYQQFQEAVKLLEQNIDESRDGLDDRRLKAQLLASRPHHSELRDARAILESLDRRNTLTAADRLLLASICDRLGEEEAAFLQWKTLLAEHGHRGRYAALFIRRQLQNRDTESAAPWLDQLEAEQPDAFQTVALRSHWLVLKGQPDRALQQLTAYAAEQEGLSAGDRGNRLIAASRQMETLAAICDDERSKQELLSAAEAVLRRSLDERPENLLNLALFLARQGKRGAALDLCEQAIGKVPRQQVNAAAVVVTRSAATTEVEVERVDRWLTETVAEEKESIAALVQLAEFRLTHEQYEESAALYRDILRRSPNHLVAMNNLAWLLSVWSNDHEQAGRLIDRAISLAGPLPALIDTRGSIALGRGDFDGAVDDFRNVVAEQETPANHFHLALAFWKLNRVEAAQFNFDKARQAGLTAEDLYPPERDDFKTLQSKLPEGVESSSEND